MASDGPLALRRARYVRGLQFDHSIAGELRVYKALPWLIGAFATLSTLGRREAAQSRETHARPLILLSLLAVVGFAGVLAYLLWDAGSGSLSIGALAFAIQGALLVLELGPAGDVAVLFGEAARTEKRIDELSILGDDGPRVARSAPTDPLTLVAFDRVQFTYPAGQAPAVDITSLHVRRGEKIAVVGRNGAGKSTLFGLLAGTLATSAGTIEMADDVHVSIALQRATRYPTTIEDNIRLGDPEVDVDAALAVTGSDGALGATRLSEHIGDPAEGTTQISGGQWQRVGLARAFGRRADLLLLDEPSAALDPESEAEFFRAALATPSVETVMLSTHHLANVRFVDRVIVLDAGRVVEDGSHADLMRANGLYARLFESQAKAYEGKGS